MNPPGALLASLLMVLMSGSPAWAGANSGGVAWLRWQGTGSQRPQGANGWSANLPVPPSVNFPLYVFLDGTHDVQAVSIELRWRVADSSMCYALASAQPTDSCGTVLLSPPPGTFPAETGYLATISFAATQSHNCVVFWYSVVGHSVGLPADFYLWRILTLDSAGLVDSLQVLGSAKILGGSGLVSPGLVVGKSVAPSTGSRSACAVSPATTSGNAIFGVTSSTAGSAVAVTLARGTTMIPASTFASVAADSATFQVSRQALSPGPYDAILKRADGSTDTLYGAIRYADTPSYADTVGRDVSVPPPPASAMSCPTRQFFIVVGSGAGGTFNYAYCTNKAITVACNLTDYPSYFTRANGQIPTVHNARYEILDCSGLPIPNVPVKIEVLPADQSAGHCHEDNASRGVGAGSVFGTACTALAGGGYACTGNTGPDGRGFTVTHVWPQVAGIMNILFFSTSSGQPFFAATDTVFHFCADQFTALSENVPETPDTLLLTGATPEHPYDHWARPGMSAALLSCARMFRTRHPTAYLLHVNDESNVWGGLLDVTQSWQPPHRAHRYGWDADVRTNPTGYSWPSCTSIQPLYTWAELQDLKVILKDNFTILQHPYGPTDYTCPHLHLTLRPHARR